MDIWGTVYVGKRWTEDDGRQRCVIAGSKEWQVSTTAKVEATAPEFKRQFKQLGAECTKAMGMQLKQIGEELLREAKYGIDRGGPDEEETPQGDGN